MRIGIDLGGTKIAAILLGADDRVVTRARIDTPRGTPEGIVAAVVALAQQLEARAGTRCSIGIGTPGSLSPQTGLLRNSNTTELNGYPLQDALSARLGRDIRMGNDADCLALSEAADPGATVFGIIAGTGIGGGVVVHGRLLTGRNGIAGEWGHNPLPWPQAGETGSAAPRCWCGKHGCIETFLSGPALAADWARHHGSPRTPPEIVRAAHAGDAAAQACLDRWHERFARALATVLNVLDPDLVVIGGGLSAIDTLYTELPARLPQWLFSDVLRTRIVPAAHGDDSGVFGAARLWER